MQMVTSERVAEVNQRFTDTGMREVLLEYSSELPPTSTYSRNYQEVPIDGIFATPSICLQGGGYFAFGDGPGSDHRWLWLDLTYQTAFGHESPAKGKHAARRLTCQDPRIRSKYSELYPQLDMRSSQLQATIVGSLSPQQAIYYESISALRSQGMEYATH
jgi:hypothetical protein